MISTRVFVVSFFFFILLAHGAQSAPVIYGTNPVKGQYIVLIKPDEVRSSQGVRNHSRSRPSVAEFANRRAQVYGGRIQHVYEHSVRGFSAKMTRRQAEQLANDPAILLIEEDQVITVVETTPNATWGLDRIDQPDLPLDNTYHYQETANTVHAYVIDTGINVSHNEFGGRALVGFDSIADGGNGNDCHGHGTHVAGTLGGSIYGVAKGVNLYAVRVLGCDGAGTTSGVIAGIDWVTANHKSPAVANMSLGGPSSVALDNAVRNSISSGVTYAVAAGNENRNACTGSPARLAEAITVGASTENDVRASFSNFGSCLDIFAPGTNITSAWVTSNNATRTISGTSMSAPHAAGVAALYLAQNPGKTPAEVEAALVGNGVTGRLNSIGSGSPNILLQSLFAGGGSNEPVPLTNGEVIQNISGNIGERRFYTIAVPAGANNLEIISTGGSGNADMFVRFGAAPDLTSYDCLSNSSGNAESCVFSTPSQGVYHVMLYANTAYSGLSLVGRYAVDSSNESPIADFDWTANGLEVAFRDTSKDTDGVISSWSWVFGDGGSASEQNPRHTYNTAGNYTVSLTVTDDSGASATDTAIVIVNEPVIEPCSACDSFTGSLSAGQTVYQPNGTYYYSRYGIHEAWLEGASGTNFDLRLYRWTGRYWRVEASATGASSSEHIRYRGRSGYYIWALKSSSGNGDYRFWLARP